MKTVKYMYLAIITTMTGLAAAEPVPAEFSKRNVNPPLLDLSKGTTHSVIDKSTIGSSMYYLIEQRPRLGDWSYVLIEKPKAAPAKFRGAGTIIDVIQQPLPQPVREFIASAYVSSEQGPLTRDFRPITKQMQANYNEVKSYLPTVLRREYKKRGFE